MTPFLTRLSTAISILQELNDFSCEELQNWFIDCFSSFFQFHHCNQEYLPLSFRQPMISQHLLVLSFGMSCDMRLFLLEELFFIAFPLASSADDQAGVQYLALDYAVQGFPFLVIWSSSIGHYFRKCQQTDNSLLCSMQLNAWVFMILINCVQHA